MMNEFGRFARARAAAAGILGLLALGAAAEEPMPYDPPVSAAQGVVSPETVISGWPGRARDEARAMIAKYGAPTAYDGRSLVWYMNGPWRKTVVYRRAPGSFLGYRAKDVLEQSIVHAVPQEKIPALNRFDDRLRFDRSNGQLSARSGSEKLNYLALNLADEIVAGKETSAEARDFYFKTIKLSESGKSSEYMERLLFIRARPAPAPAIKTRRAGKPRDQR